MNDLKKWQSDFFANLRESVDVCRVFDHLPGLHFFIKDRQSRLVAVSRSIIERFGVSSEAEVIGRPDTSFFPPQVAAGFVRDDQAVFHSGQPILRRTEVWLNEQRMLDWSVTNKLPLFDKTGQVCGLMGTVQSLDARREMVYASASIGAVVRYIRENFQRPVYMSELARQAGLSERQLRRKFNEVLGMSPQEFLLRTRLQQASDLLLRTDEPIRNVAVSSGFADHSSFSQHFRAHLGVSPIDYRRRR
jgi:AraC-like DNA-binding protein